MRADEATSGGASWKTILFSLYNLMSSSLIGDKACINKCEQQTRRSLTDNFYMVVQWYEWIIVRSYSTRMCALHPNENMRSRNRHYTTVWYEDDGIYSVFLMSTQIPGRLKQGRKRIEQHLSATVITDQINSS